MQLEVFAAPAPEPSGDARPGIEPVARETEIFDAAALVKAVQMNERQQSDVTGADDATTEDNDGGKQDEEKDAKGELEDEAAGEQDERRPSTCDAGDSGFGTVQRRVAAAGIELRCRFGVDTVYGVGGRAGGSDHPGGRALDLMVGRDPGEELAAYAVENMDRLGIKYVIYRQRINTGSGWKAMEDRGGTTANHMDHVHISFK